MTNYTDLFEYYASNIVRGNITNTEDICKKVIGISKSTVIEPN